MTIITGYYGSEIKFNVTLKEDISIPVDIAEGMVKSALAIIIRNALTQTNVYESLPTTETLRVTMDECVLLCEVWLGAVSPNIHVIRRVDKTMQVKKTILEETKKPVRIYVDDRIEVMENYPKVSILEICHKIAEKPNVIRKENIEHPKLEIDMLGGRVLTIPIT